MFGKESMNVRQVVRSVDLGEERQEFVSMMNIYCW